MVNERIRSHLDRPNVLGVRYERWSEDPEAVLEELASFLEVELDPKALDIVAPDESRAPNGKIDPRELAELCPSAALLGYT